MLPPMAAFTYVWRFSVPAPHRAAFEALYGPGGDWVRLFRTSQDWLGTDLLRDRDRPGEYLTVDRWSSRAAHEAFHQSVSADWEEIDHRGLGLTSHEELIGQFEPVAQPKK